MARNLSVNITDAALKAAVKAARLRLASGEAKAPIKITVGQGAQLWVMDADPARGCCWRLPYRFEGKQKILALGVCTINSTNKDTNIAKLSLSGVTLAEARDKAIQARLEIAAGVDPSAERKAEKQAQQAQTVNRFAEVAEEWFKQQEQGWTTGHAQQVWDSLERDVFPVFGSKAVNEIKPMEVLAMLRAIESRGALDVAGRVRQRCNAVFRYAVMTERASSNPAADLSPAMKKRKAEHRPALPLPELPQFLALLHDPQLDLQLTTRAALRFIVLTFTRPGEVRFARWAEIDLDNTVWNIPAERMKMRRPHRVPLSRQALDVLREIQPLTGRYDLIFPSDRDHTKALSENTLGYAINRMGWHKRATAHGFRAVASTILNETGRFHADAVERQLAHVDNDAIRAAYHRAEYWDERVKMMQWYADYLDKLKGANDIPASFTKQA